MLLFFHWYLGYTSTRSYSNVAECLFFMLALLQDSYAPFLFFAGVACMVRVTALLALLPLFVFHVVDILRQKGTVRGLIQVVITGLVMVAIILKLLVGIDYIFYQRLILTPYNFFYTNIFLEVSKYYGVYPWSYYFLVSFPITTGFSVVLLALLPHAVAGQRISARARRLVGRLFVTLFSTIFLNSFVAHKENRFLFLLLPINVVLCAFVLAVLARGMARARLPLIGLAVPLVLVKLLVEVLFAIGVFLFVFFGYTYRTGTLSLMAYIRHSPHVYQQLDVMTCCYASPGYSQVHRKVEHLELNDCPMILDPETKKRELYADLLYRKAPVLYLNWRYTRSPALYKSEAAQRELFDSVDDSLTPEEFWPLAKKLFPENEPVVLPDGLMIFTNVADALKETVLLPNGYVLETRARHAFVLFEPHEDLFIDLWRRTI
ncbi:phosphatidylinositol glycan, class B [Strigomonas culicis]|nr:phosphatidylinositol glycan, class B [Strigomonas culicis]|eukprot:EPY23965.1 phosphatidylinositol glycan, class B [Strigomonas culicis]